MAAASPIGAALGSLLVQQRGDVACSSSAHSTASLIRRKRSLEHTRGRACSGVTPDDADRAPIDWSRDRAAARVVRLRATRFAWACSAWRCRPSSSPCCGSA